MCDGFEKNEFGSVGTDNAKENNGGIFSCPFDASSVLEELDTILDPDQYIEDNKYVEGIRKDFFGDDKSDYIGIVSKYIDDESDVIVIGDRIEDFIVVYGSGSADGMIGGVEKLLKDFEKEKIYNERNYDFIEAFCIAFLGYKCDERDKEERKVCMGGNTNDTIDLNDFLKKLKKERMTRKSQNVKE